MSDACDVNDVSGDDDVDGGGYGGVQQPQFDDGAGGGGDAEPLLPHSGHGLPPLLRIQHQHRRLLLPWHDGPKLLPTAMPQNRCRDDPFRKTHTPVKHALTFEYFKTRFYSYLIL